MKHAIAIFIVLTLFPVAIWSQTITIADMHHDDDTVDVEYNKSMLQGKVWAINIPEGIEADVYLGLTFIGDSVFETCRVDGETYNFKGVYFLSDSYLMEFDDKYQGSNQSGKYLQIKFVDVNCDGKGDKSSKSYWIRKLTSDALELVEWRSQHTTDDYHAKSEHDTDPTPGSGFCIVKQGIFEP